MDHPIACTLRPSEYTDRTAQLTALAASALRSRTPIAGGERLVFAPGAATEGASATPLRPRPRAARSCAWTSVGARRARARHHRPGRRAADHRGAVRMSAAKKLGAGALVMALCCALLPLAGAALGGRLIAGTGPLGSRSASSSSASSWPSWCDADEGREGAESPPFRAPPGGPGPAQRGSRLAGGRARRVLLPGVRGRDRAPLASAPSLTAAHDRVGIGAGERGRSCRAARRPSTRSRARPSPGRRAGRGPADLAGAVAALDAALVDGAVAARREAVARRRARTCRRPRRDRTRSARARSCSAGPCRP